jgi:Protein of unknown function (DUF1688)
MPVGSSAVTSKITDATAAARALQSAQLVRRRAQQLLALASADALEEWRLDRAQLPTTTALVCEVVRERYPRLDPPLHARWRHFVFQGRDLWQQIEAAQYWPDAAARARAAFDLAISSVLLDAGAGPDWRYSDAGTGLAAGRSEGLALASLRWFQRGGLANDAGDPLRADAARLARLDAAAFAEAFQVSADNPLHGLAGRVQLLNRLGSTLLARPELFARQDSPRPGGLFDVLALQAAQQPDGALPAAAILQVLLDAFGPIWQNRPVLGGIALGDCWPHPALQSRSPEPGAGYVPLHKLSQWLAYSLIEPLQQAGIRVRDIGALTGLAEYRNGGLFVDMGVLVPRRDADLSATHAIDSPFVVGWRSLTVALLDELAPLVRAQLDVSDATFPLACLLEGGTWAAGRRIAAERRADGGPPLKITSDGTVF